MVIKEIYPMKAHSATQPIKPSSVLLRNLTYNLTRVMNKYVGKKPNTPLTVETLEEIQEKFWSPIPDVGDNGFMKEVWAVCNDAVKEVIDSQQVKKSVNQISSGKKRPVVYSTREGIDVAIALEQNGNGLEASDLNVNPGGSAINVARSLNNFGSNFDLIGIHGMGPKGDAFIRSLRNEGITNGDFVIGRTDGRTHFCTPHGANEYWLVDALPMLTTNDVDEVTNKVLKACKQNEKEILALANGAPDRADETYMPEIVEITQDKHGMFTIYDPKKNAVGKNEVIAVLEKSPGLIKPNLVELGELTDTDETLLRQDRNLAIHLAQELIKQFGVKMVLVSMDKDGAFLVDKKRAIYGNAPKIVVGSPGCAGDTGIAAIIDRSKKEGFSLHKPNDAQFKELLKAFLGAGAATAAKKGSNLGTLQEALELEKQVTVVNL